MSRTLGYPVRRIALAVALTILGGALLAHALHRGHARSDAAPARVRGEAAPTVATLPTPLEATTGPASARAGTPARAPSAPATPYGAAGMVVGIDPETGKLGLPTKAQRAGLERAAAMSPAIDRSDAGLTVIHKPDGSMMVDLQGRFQDYAVVRIAPDGTKSESCVQESGLDAALHGGAAPSTDAPITPSDPPHAER